VRIAVVGAGAVGGLLAARLARAGAPVALVARGDALAAIRERGLVVKDRGGEWTAHPVACGSPSELGAQDLVILATKAHALPAAAPGLAPLLERETVVASAVNGIPWWYFHGEPGSGHSPHLASVDPGGVVWNAIGPSRALGCVVHLGASSPNPGIVEHAYGLQLLLGEPDGRPSPRLEAAVEALAQAGFKSSVAADIRTEAWRKLLYNVAINPVSLVTGLACDAIHADPALRSLLASMVEEASCVAAALGRPVPVDVAQVVAGFGAIGAFRTSMLQDHDAGRAPEVEPILGAVVELAARCGVPAPNLADVLARARALTGKP
jgi:2-dehydropantoate 2-reductase